MNRRGFLASAGGAVGLAVGAARGARPSGGYEPLGVTEVPGARDAAVHHDGEVVYVAATDGFAAVDISDPGTPTVLAERREIDTGGDGEFGGAWDLWPSDDRLVVVGPATHAPRLESGLALFDISDPADPRQVAWHGTDHHIHNSFFDGETVYLTGSGTETHPLVVVDVSDDEPVERARWSIVDHDERWTEVPNANRILHDVYVRDGIAYLPYWDAGTWLVDVESPAEPEVLSRVGGFEREELAGLSDAESSRVFSTPPGSAHYAQVDQNAEILLVGQETWELPGPDGDTVGGPGGVDLWDVTDARSPEHLATIDAPESFDNTRSGWWTTAHNCDIVADRVYCSWYFGGVTVHDISDPTTPERLAWWRDPTAASFWTAQVAVPGETFVASSVNLGASRDVPTETTAGVYVFPDEAGTQTDPPDLTAAPESTPTPTPTVSPTPGETDSSADDDGADLGVVGALGGVGALSALAWRRRCRGEENSPQGSRGQSSTRSGDTRSR